MNHRPLAAAATLTTALLLTMPAGCARSTAFTETEPYPAAFIKLTPSNIQIYRSGKTIYLTNTTAQHFGPSTIWLNQWFARKIDGLAIGESATLPLASFKDKFGDEFRGGGFFATVEPDLIVLAELELDTEPTADNPTGRALLPLIVVGKQQDN